MRKHFHKILFFNTIAVMVILFIQTVTGVVKLKPLHGATTETEKPELTFKNFIDGSFQNNTEQYLREHFGFREWLIRLYNQFLWSCFRETNNSTIVRGKDDWLFEEVYVRNYYESLMYQYTDDTAELRRTFETEALRLKKVQELLEEHNIHLFVVIAPCKDVIYPEYLPENLTYNRPDGLHAYDYYRKRFDELGVNYIDFVPIFKNLKDSVDFLLFPKTGTHWTNIASVYAFDSILHYMEILGSQNLVDLEISEKYQAETRHFDNDLEEILNLAFPIKSPPNLYVNVNAQDDTMAVKPNFIAIGDSYFWHIIYNIPLQNIFQHYPYWYYNSSIYCDDEHTSTLEIDLEQELMKSDYIMLIYNPLTMYELGSRFLSRALLRLCYDQASIDSMSNRIIHDIKSLPEWYNDYVENAKNSHRNIEQALHDDTHYMIEENPEKYFKDLQGEGLPIPRNKDMEAIRKSMHNTRFP